MFKGVKIMFEKMFVCKEDKIGVIMYCGKRKLFNWICGEVIVYLIVC